MIIKVSVSSADAKLLTLPDGRILQIYDMTFIDQSGASNTIRLHDKGNFYDGTDFSSTYDVDVAEHSLSANGVDDVKFQEPREVQNELWGVGTGAGEVIINAKLL